MRGGYYYYPSGSLFSGGTDGFYWAPHLDGAMRGYRLTFTSGSIYPINALALNYGFTLRCLDRYIF